MKLSLNFLKDYVDIDVDVKKLAEDMTSAGSEYDEAGKLIEATNLIIGKVIKCENHPDSDHLHVCKVDVGNEVLDIVCGAPNVRENLKVIVALNGAELPGGIKIKKGVIRGQESNGMLCSLLELGIESKFLTEEDKNGIHELDENAPVGKDPIEYMNLNDEVIDFDLTANRGDLLSVLGMAYEVGAIYDKKVKDIDLSYNGIEKDMNFNLEIATDNCKAFLAKKVENLSIKESPDFIKNRLIASGIRPINNVVDISNYVMLEVGQPLHFYDADKLGSKIKVRMAENGEELTTLDGIKRTLDSEDIVITDGEKSIGLAGVMGGLDTEVTLDTKNVIIEAAIFDSVKVRKTSKKVVRSEASNRFEKGLDSNRTYMAIERACSLLEKYADAKVISQMVSYDKTEKEDKQINLAISKTNRILGTNISKEDIIKVFEKLAFKVEVIDEDKLNVIVPRRRIDISIEEDLVEEVGRIYGVNNIQGKLPSIPMRAGNYDKTLREIRNKIIDLGLNETLSYVLINEEESNKFKTEQVNNIPLADPMTEERSRLRHKIIVSLMKIYEYNYAREIKDVSIFEIGKTFYELDDKYNENLGLAGLMAGNYSNGLEKKKIDFYVVKGICEELLDYLGYNGRYSFVANREFPSQLHPYQSAYISVNNDVVGFVGKVHPNECKQDVFVFEINLDKLLSKKVGKMKFKEISKYPTISKDLALVVNKDLTSEEISKAIKKSAGNLLTGIEVFDVYSGEKLGADKKSIAFSLKFGTNNRTLTDEEVNAILENIIKDMENKLKAEIRR